MKPAKPPHLNDNIRYSTVFPDKVITDICESKFIFLSVNPEDEVTGILVSLQERLELKDSHFKCLRLDKLSSTDFLEGIVNVVCCGDLPLSRIAESAKYVIALTPDKGFLKSQYWNESWAMLRISVRDCFYNRYELITSDDVGESSNLSLDIWGSSDFQKHITDKAYIYDDRDFLSKPFTADPYELPDHGEAF